MPAKKAIDRIIKDISKQAEKEGAEVPDLPNLKENNEDTFNLEEELRKDMLKSKYHSYCCLFPHKNFQKLKTNISIAELEDRLEYCRLSSQMATDAIDTSTSYIISNLGMVIEKLLPKLTKIPLDGLTDMLKEDSNFIITLKMLLVENLEYIQIDPRIRLIGLLVFAVIKCGIQNMVNPKPSPEKTEELKKKYDNI